MRVTDTGRGIARAFLPQVFERFRQADSTATRSAGGLGLGLFIARRLVDAHGGSIRAESEGEGRGSTFTVCLPIAAERLAETARPAPGIDRRETGTPDDPAQTSLEGIRVLIVDDDAGAREVMASALETSGATVTAAASAEEALELLTGDRTIDVLLSDIAMPGHDGYDLIRQLRSRSSHLAALPAAAVTACASSEERERALAAGFQLHLSKPVLPHVLVEAVANLRTGIARL